MVRLRDVERQGLHDVRRERPERQMNTLALSAGDLALTTQTGLKLEVRRIKVRSFNGRVMVHVGFTTGQRVTLNIARGRVEELRDLLTTVIEK